MNNVNGRQRAHKNLSRVNQLAEHLTRHRVAYIAVGIAAALVVGTYTGVGSSHSHDVAVASDPQQEIPDALASAAATESAIATGGTTVTVHVVGAVKRPGVYTLDAGSRVVDAVSLAGGVAIGAAAEAVNMAALLADGSQVYIPTRTQVRAGWQAAPAGVASSGAAPGQTSGGPVDINSASQSALESLPGIGEVTAAKIVAEREANGPYTSLEDLTRVAGIGEKKVAALRGLAVAR